MSRQKQKCVTVSRTEAEYIATSETAKSIIWLARLFGEITTLTAVPLLRIDNMSFYLLTGLIYTVLMKLMQSLIIFLQKLKEYIISAYHMNQLYQ